MTNLTQKAITKALELHSGQTRKDEITPYIVHPLAVGYIIAHFTSDEAVVAAAILHDTVEDTDYQLDTMKEEFGDNVAYWVDLLTEDKSITSWALRKDKAIEKVAQDRTALVIKASDCLANMRDIYQGLREHGQQFWESFHAPKEQEQRYFEIVLDKAKEFLPADLLKDYVSMLKDLEYSDNITVEKQIGFFAS